MHRNAWVALAVVLGSGLLGAFLLGHALEKTIVLTTPSLAPRGAMVVEDRSLGGIPEQRVVTWRLGGRPEDPSSSLYGVTIWQAGRALYSHRARRGAVGLHVETGHLANDTRADILVFDDLDGSGGCGIYRVLKTRRNSVRQVHARQLCEDQGSIHLGSDGLHVALGVQRDEKYALQAHCCYRFVRRSLKQWIGGRLVTTSSTLERIRPEHPVPGGYAPS